MVTNERRSVERGADGTEGKRKAKQEWISYRHEVMSDACQYQNEDNQNMLTMRLLFRHCAVLYLKGMAFNHLVISKLQHLLENSSNADVHEAMTLASVASQQKISLVHIRCFAGRLGRPPIWMRCPPNTALGNFMHFPDAVCSLLKCSLQSMRDVWVIPSSRVLQCLWTLARCSRRLFFLNHPLWKCI